MSLGLLGSVQMKKMQLHRIARHWHAVHLEGSGVELSRWATFHQVRFRRGRLRWEQRTEEDEPRGEHNGAKTIITRSSYMHERSFPIVIPTSDKITRHHVWNCYSSVITSACCSPETWLLLSHTARYCSQDASVSSPREYISRVIDRCALNRPVPLFLSVSLCGCLQGRDLFASTAVSEWDRRIPIAFSSVSSLEDTRLAFAIFNEHANASLMRSRQPASFLFTLFPGFPSNAQLRITSSASSYDSSSRTVGFLWMKIVPISEYRWRWIITLWRSQRLIALRRNLYRFRF